MGKLKDKLYDWKDRLRDRKMMSLVILLVAIIALLGTIAYRKEMQYRQLSENGYNNAFYQLNEYVNNVEKFLAKATISNSSKHANETLTNLIRESALAQAYLSRLPIATQDLENTEKFLNQVGDYSYSLVKKTTTGSNLSQEELDNLTQLHEYSVDLENTLNELESELYSGTIKWGELEKKGKNAFDTEKDNISQSSFSSIEEDLHQYEGLIYDGAYSENSTNNQQKALTGDEIDIENAKKIATDFIGKDKISEIYESDNSQEKDEDRGNSKEEETNNISNSKNQGSQSDTANIECYNFTAKTINKSEYTISVSKKGGHVILMNCNRQIQEQSINEEDAVKIGKEFLEKNNYKNMKETYYLSNENILTVNYAYMQNEITMYPDLIKIKIALDNGEILGVETTKYINSHTDERAIGQIKITKEEAIKLINPKLEIKSTDMAIIPTEWNTEVLCWEIKGKSANNDFIVYINASTGEEEDILMIVDTPNGTLTT